MDACRADYRQGRAQESSRSSDPFRYAPLMWEYHQRNPEGARRARS